jgi:hypothetical protein
VVFVLVGIGLLGLAAVAEGRRRRLGPAASRFQAGAPVVIGLCGVVDLVLAVLLARTT